MKPQKLLVPKGRPHTPMPLISLLHLHDSAALHWQIWATRVGAPLSTKSWICLCLLSCFLYLLPKVFLITASHLPSFLPSLESSHHNSHLELSMSLIEILMSFSTSPWWVPMIIETWYRGTCHLPWKPSHISFHTCVQPLIILIFT